MNGGLAVGGEGSGYSIALPRGRHVGTALRAVAVWGDAGGPGRVPWTQRARAPAFLGCLSGTQCPHTQRQLLPLPTGPASAQGNVVASPLSLQAAPPASPHPLAVFLLGPRDGFSAGPCAGPSGGGGWSHASPHVPVALGSEHGGQPWFCPWCGDRSKGPGGRRHCPPVSWAGCPRLGLTLGRRVPCS